MGASPGVFDGAEGESMHTLGLNGKRRGEEAASQGAEERPPVHHSIT